MLSPMPFRLNHPNRFAIVPNPVLVAGFGTAFEGEAQVRITDGHDEVVERLPMGGTGTVAQFHRRVDLAGAAFQLTRLFIEVFELSARDGSEIRHVFRPILFGPGIMSDATPPTIAPFNGWFERVVVAGDTLSGIADDVYGDASKFPRIAAANVHTVPDPNLIFPGQVLRIPV